MPYIFTDPDNEFISVKWLIWPKKGLGERKGWCLATILWWPYLWAVYGVKWHSNSILVTSASSFWRMIPAGLSGFMLCLSEKMYYDLGMLYRPSFTCLLRYSWQYRDSFWVLWSKKRRKKCIPLNPWPCNVIPMTIDRDIFFIATRSAQNSIHLWMNFAIVYVREFKDYVS